MRQDLQEIYDELRSIENEENKLVDELLELINEMLENAQRDVKICPRGSNYGRVKALEEIQAAALEIVNK